MKKNEISENFYQNNLFSFDTFSCECAIDVIHLNPNETNRIYKLVGKKEKPIKFCFQPQIGLSRISNKNGSIEEENILSSFLAIRDNDINGFTRFFEQNGFFYPVSFTNYENIDYSTLKILSKKMKMTMELMSQLSEVNRKDYKKILFLTMNLLLDEQKKLTIGNNTYYTCEHKLLKEAIINAASKKFDSWNQKLDNEYNFEVKDSTYNTYKVNIDYFNHWEGDLDVLNDFMRKIAHAYVCDQDSNINHRKIIELIFHLYFDIGEFYYDSNNGITFNYPDKVNWDNFDDKFKETLLSVSKLVLGEEINSNLNGIYPEYDINIMEPRWRVNSLLSAMYFSIFYLKPNIELTRLCANPKCGKYFVVSRTSLKKKYCCTACANRAIQNRHRNKKKASC